MNQSASSEAAKAVVRRNTEEVQSKGNFELFEELFADDFVDHTPQPGTTPDKDGARVLYHGLREGFPDFRADIQWQVADDNLSSVDCSRALAPDVVGVSDVGNDASAWA